MKPLKPTYNYDDYAQELKERLIDSQRSILRTKRLKQKYNTTKKLKKLPLR